VSSSPRPAGARSSAAPAELASQRRYWLPETGDLSAELPTPTPTQSRTSRCWRRSASQPRSTRPGHLAREIAHRGWPGADVCPADLAAAPRIPTPSGAAVGASQPPIE